MRVSRVENSWLGRIVLYKMLILPRILYALRTLAIPIPKRIFDLFHRQMTKYVWQGKRPRLALTLMNKRPSMGGLGLPNLHAYHLAITLDQAKHWWRCPLERPWSKIEAATIGVSDWRAVLLDPLPELPCIPLAPPSVRVTLQYWRKICNEGNPLNEVTHLPIPLSFVLLHIPDIRLKHWEERGILLLEHLYDGASLHPFLELRQKYGLQPSDIYLYNQITHLIRSIPSKQRAIPARVMALLSASSQPLVKGTRGYYDLLTQNVIFSKTPNILRWETDFQKTFTPLYWQKAIQWAHRSSSCANHREQYQKLLTRWYFTPLRLAKAFPTSSPLCWRSCGSQGSIIHVFWSCPHLRLFWNSVIGIISRILGAPCPTGPEFLLLLIGIHDTPRSGRTVPVIFCMLPDF